MSMVLCKISITLKFSFDRQMSRYYEFPKTRSEFSLFFLSYNDRKKREIEPFYSIMDVIRSLKWEHSAVPKLLHGYVPKWSANGSLVALTRPSQVVHVVMLRHLYSIMISSLHSQLYEGHDSPTIGTTSPCSHCLSVSPKCSR